MLAQTFHKTAARRAAAHEFPHTMYADIRYDQDKRYTQSIFRRNALRRTICRFRTSRTVTFFFPGSHCTHAITVAAIENWASRPPSHHHTITIRSRYDHHTIRQTIKNRQSEPGITLAGQFSLSPLSCARNR